MSGSSYGYAHSEMARGEVTLFAQFAVDFRDALLTLARGAPTWDESARPMTPDEERAIMAVVYRLDVAIEAIDKVRAFAKELAPIAHAIEWERSGDTGWEDTVKDCVEWAKGRLR